MPARGMNQWWKKVVNHCYVPQRDTGTCSFYMKEKEKADKA